jgi:hypothetical protein
MKENVGQAPRSSPVTPNCRLAQLLSRLFVERSNKASGSGVLVSFLRYSGVLLRQEPK